MALTEAGRALLPHAEDIYRGILNARTALKGFGTHHTLTLRLPPVLLQRDPIYPILMARLHAALPGYEFKVDTTPVPSSDHHMLCTEADAALYLPFGPLPPEISCETIIGNRFYLIAAPEHPFSGQSSVELSALAGQQIFYEPLYQDMVDFARKQPGMPYSTPVWRMVENYESVYAELLAGRGMFLCPMIYPAFPAGWHIPLHLSIPDTCLLTLRDDPRPEICTLRRVFAEVYTEREKLIKALRDAKTPPCNAQRRSLFQKELYLSISLRSCRWSSSSVQTILLQRVPCGAGQPGVPRRRGGQGVGAFSLSRSRPSPRPMTLCSSAVTICLPGGLGRMMSSSRGRWCRC